MAVDSATLSTASGILKENFEGGVVNQINNPGAIFKEVEKTSRDVVEGTKVVMNLRMNPSQALGGRAELGALPAPRRTRNVRTEFNLKYMYGTMRITGPLMEASRTDAAAFIKAVRNETEGLQEGLKLDLARQVWGSEANDGRIALCGTSTATRTIQLAAGTNMLYFEIGMIIDLKVLSSGADITDGVSREVVGIDEDNLTITIDSNGNVVTTSSAHGVFREDCRNTELNGLEAIIGTATLQNVDPSTSGNERWKSRVNANFGAFSLMKLQVEIDKIHNKSGEWIDRIYSSETPRNLYLQTLVAQRRIVTPGDAPKKDLDGGWSGLSYSGGGAEAVWVKDPMAPSDSTIYFVNMKRLSLRRSKDFEFIEISGSRWIPEISGANGVDAYKAVLATYHQLTTDKRSAHGKAQGVTA